MEGSGEMIGQIEWLAKKYIQLSSFKLMKFKQKSNDLWNFRCPFCMDSDKSKSKARGYIYLGKGQYRFHCHNCSEAFSFDQFLKRIDDGLYLQYTKEKLQEQRGKPEPFAEDPKNESIQYKLSLFDPLVKVSKLSPAHPCKKYVTSRKIPSHYHYKLFYAENYPKFVNSIIEDKLPPRKDSRLVIPFMTKDGEVIGFTGRSLDPANTTRYLDIMLAADSPKVFGMDTTDFNRSYLVFEGPIDAMFIKNSIAICGGALHQGLEKLGVNRDNAVLVYDNERRNKQILTNLSHSVDRGYPVVLWPETIGSKDVNEMILDNYTVSEIEHILRANIFQGPQAKMALAAWRRD
jgi:hypothetical protein